MEKFRQLHISEAKRETRSIGSWEKQLDMIRNNLNINKSEFKNLLYSLDISEDYLEENIENSITLHWIYIHRDRLDELIEEYV